MKVDDLDLKILQHLQNNGRMSYRELGRILDTPHTTIFTRVEKLKNKGVINKFAALIHPHEQNAQIGVIVINSSPNQSKKLAEEISKHKEAKKVFRTLDGKIIIKAVVTNEGGQQGLEELLSRLNDHPMTVYPIHEVVKYDHTIHDEILRGG